MGRREGGELLINEDRAAVGEEVKVLEMDGGDGCTVSMY